MDRNYTRFGETLRILRTKEHENMQDVAAVLKTSSPTLCMVERGKANVPSAWLPRLKEHYNLTEDELKSLEQQAIESRIFYKINTSNKSRVIRELAYKFAKCFDTLSEEQAKSLLDILEGLEAE